MLLSPLNWTNEHGLWSKIQITPLKPEFPLNRTFCLVLRRFQLREGLTVYQTLPSRSYNK